MTNNLIKSMFVFCILSVFLTNCANAQTISSQNKTKNGSSSAIDLSTDKAVIDELQKLIDEKNAGPAQGDAKLEAKRRAAGKLEAKDVCIERLIEAEIIVIGFFETDNGCRFEGAFVDRRYFERNDRNLSKTALAALGWEKAAKKERQKLAVLWVEKALLVFSPLPAQSLSAVSNADGSIKVTASSKRPPGVTSRSVTKIFVFDKDGNLAPPDNY